MELFKITKVKPIVIGMKTVNYATKSLTKSGTGRFFIDGVKAVSGLYFDCFCQGRYKTEGLTFDIPREQTTLRLRGRFAADTYEWPERVLIRRHLPSNATLLELGGCIGVVSCIANRCLEMPRAHVVVEANPKLIPILQRNRDANGAEFAIEHAAVSRKPVRLAVDQNMDSSRAASKGIPVPIITLEALQEKHGLTFDAIAMDIEGAETAFLDENPDALSRIRFLMIEFHPDIVGKDSLQRLRNLLQKTGLRRQDKMLATEVYLGGAG
jgi:FkbM family methyltransferase